MDKLTDRDKFRIGLGKMFKWYGIDIMDDGLGWQLWTDIAEYFTHE